MKRHYQIFTAVFLLTYLCGNFVLAQTSSRLAQQWFDTGRTTKDLTKKIEAFHKAVEADPKFVQALYYLGLTYKSRKDFVRAELFLNQAKAASSSLRKAEDRFAIYYELSKVHLRSGNTTMADKLLRESLNLKVKDEFAGKAYFELGRLLFNQSRYQDALDALTAGQRLNSVYKDFFNNLIVLSKNSIRLEQLYNQAEQQMQSGNIKEAKNLFEQIKLESSDFRNVQAKIAKVDSILKEQLTLSTLKELYNQAENYAREENYTLAIANYESILQKSSHYRDVGTRLANARTRLQEQQVAKIMSNNYQEGLNAFNRRDWPRAISSFGKVIEMDASYLDTRKKLAEARRQVQPDTLENVLFRYYKFGLESMENDEFDEALRAFKRVEKLKPGYKNVSNLIAVLGQAVMPETGADLATGNTTQALPFSASELDSLYTEALILMDNQDWIQAVVFLEKLRLIKEDYRDIENLLFEARTNLAKNDPIQISRPVAPDVVNYVLVGGSFIALVFLPLLGFVLFSPMARARLYLLRGNYSAAALIYENALMKNPGMLKLYPKLAHIYLLSGRNDENAIKVFKTVLKLNLETNEKTEMNSVVGNYLKAGNTEEDAISVLEKALRAEREKQAIQK